MDLTGTIVPLVTPFDAEEFDAQAMGRLIAWILGQGADALMPTALTGEGPLLTPEETVAVWAAVFELVAGDVPVVPAIIATTTREASHLVRIAEGMGAAAVMVAPILPELYAGRSYDDVWAFYADVASTTSLSIILFNYPSLTGIDFTLPLVARLVEIDNVRSIKESSGDTRRVHQLRRGLGDRLTVICGTPNTALESLALGCKTWITGIMNAVPRSAQQMMRAMDLGDLPLARRIYYGQMLPLVDVLATNYNPTGTIKAAVRARGVGVGAPRRPGSDVAPEDWQHLSELMVEIARAEERTALLLQHEGSGDADN